MDLAIADPISASLAAYFVGTAMVTAVGVGAARTAWNSKTGKAIRKRRADKVKVARAAARLTERVATEAAKHIAKAGGTGAAAAVTDAAAKVAPTAVKLGPGSRAVYAGGRAVRATWRGSKWAARGASSANTRFNGWASPKLAGWLTARADRASQFKTGRGRWRRAWAKRLNPEEPAPAPASPPAAGPKPTDAKPAADNTGSKPATPDTPKTPTGGAAPDKTPSNVIPLPNGGSIPLGESMSGEITDQVRDICKRIADLANVSLDNLTDADVIALGAGLSKIGYTTAQTTTNLAGRLNDEWNIDTRSTLVLTNAASACVAFAEGVRKFVKRYFDMYEGDRQRHNQSISVIEQPKVPGSNKRFWSKTG